MNFDKYELAAIGMAVILTAVFIYGAFSYPYLENDDPWGHAQSAKYIATEKTILEKPEYPLKYIDPYPPLYDVFMAIPIALGLPTFFTLKLFNALLCGVAIYVFYHLAVMLLNSKRQAILATFIITVLPSFMSHFIWAQTLAIVLMLLALYAMASKRWILLAVSSALLFVTQPSVSVVYIIFALIYIIINKDLHSLIGNVVGGAMAFFGYWLWMFIRHGFVGTMRGVGLIKGYITDAAIDTSGGIVYTLTDIRVAPLISKMDQATGLGTMVYVLLVFALGWYLYDWTHKKYKDPVILAWLLFSFIGLQSNALPIKFLPHRFWVFLAIPVALITGKVIYRITQELLRRWRWRWIAYVVFTIIIMGIWFTSAIPKYEVQTAQWPPGTNFVMYPELRPYLMRLDTCDKEELYFIMDKIKEAKSEIPVRE